MTASTDTTVHCGRTRPHPPHDENSDAAHPCPGTPMTPEHEADIRDRAEKATPGFWGTHRDTDGTYTIRANPRLVPGHGNLYDSDIAQLLGEDDATSYRNGRFMAHAREDVPLLLTELGRLRARVAELETAAVEGCAALANLVEDHEDPGTAALGALYLLIQATIGVPAQPDQAAEVLARHDAEEWRKAAHTLEDLDYYDAANLLYNVAQGMLSYGQPAGTAEPGTVGAILGPVDRSQ